MKTKELNQFNTWLENYQVDLAKIIGKYRGSNHMLSQEELLSEINTQLLKKRESLIKYTINEGGFNENSFKKSAFVYARNLIKWSHSSAKNKSYVKRRDDRSFFDKEDGLKTSFDLAVETKGANPEDDPDNFVNLEAISEFKNILSVIKKYYDILTEQEVKVLSMMELSLSEEDIANKLNVSRQAINFTTHNIYAKVKSFINPKEVFNSSFEKIQKGKSCINNFFQNSSGYSITKPHSIFLKKLILNQPKLLTLEEATKKINKQFNLKYSKKQIACSLSKRKLYRFLKSAQ